MNESNWDASAAGEPGICPNQGRSIAMTGDEVLLADVSERGKLRLGGKDHCRLLHNLCTNDVQSLKPGSGLEAFFLDAKGKIVDFVKMYRLENLVWLDTEPGRSAELAKHLDRYVIREDVEIRDETAAYSQFHLCGGRVDAVIRGLIDEAPPGSMGIFEYPLGASTIQVRRSVRSLFPGYDILVPTADVQELLARIQSAAGDAITPMDEATSEALRIEAGLPAFGKDITRDNLPQEIGRDQQAINFNKGCYIGQETVARIDAMGHVNRRLRRLRIDGSSVPATGDKVLSGEKEVGAITSAASFPSGAGVVAMAMIRTILGSGEYAVQIATKDGLRAARVLPTEPTSTGS